MATLGRLLTCSASLCLSASLSQARAHGLALLLPSWVALFSRPRNCCEPQFPHF